MPAETIVINEGTTLEPRTSATGKVRFSIKVTAEPLEHTLDAKELGRKPAEAIADVIRQKIAAIAVAASPATLRARRVAAKAYALAKPWALKRYAGGRIGAMAPNQEMSLFNDSGRMEKSVVAGAGKDDAWRVNVAANRLDPSTADHGGEAAVAAMWLRLVELVPELGSAAKLLSDFQVRRAVQDATRGIIRKRAATARSSAVATVRALFGVANQVGELLAG